MPPIIDISKFKRVKNLLNNTDWIFVIKSQNQIERRKSMLESKAKGKYGTLGPREPGRGLVLRGRLKNGRVEMRWAQGFFEPRHIYWSEIKKAWRVTTIDKLVYLDKDGRRVGQQQNRLFGSLHTAEGHGKRILVVSSGYDSVLEYRETDKLRTYFWNAWEHGFNPDPDGYWLTLSQNKFHEYQKEGKKAKLVEPFWLGIHGLLTSHRSAHPNMAVYDPYNRNSFIVSIAYTGILYRVSFKTGIPEPAFRKLHQMPHGLRAYNGGWIVTDTTVGELVRLNSKFHQVKRFSVAKLPGKPMSVGDAEWLQTSIPGPGKCSFLLVDSNRGLLAISTCRRQYTLYSVDPNWSIQDAVYLPDPKRKRTREEVLGNGSKEAGQQVRSDALQEREEGDAGDAQDESGRDSAAQGDTGEQSEEEKTVEGR
jgi:hypothetical protein